MSFVLNLSFADIFLVFHDTICFFGMKNGKGEIVRHYCRSSHKLAENGKRNWGRSFALTFQMKLILLKYYHQATIPLYKQNIFCLISCQNIFFIFLFTICNIWSYLAKSPASTVNETRCFGASCRKFFLCLNIYRAPNPGEPPTPIPSPLTQILTLPHTHFTVHTQLPCFKYISRQC